MNIHAFTEKTYLPFTQETLALSTIKGYADLWSVYKAHIPRTATFDTFKTVHAQAAISDIARKRLASSTLGHIKAFFSGVWSHAQRTGVTEVNPWKAVRLPRGEDTKETEAFTTEEVTAMLSALPDPARVVVAVAAYTGLRKSEIRGLAWSDIDFELGVARLHNAFTDAGASRMKSKASKAPIALPGALCDILAAFKRDNRSSNSVFASRAGTPLDLHNLQIRDINPVINTLGIKWKGWHAFRRGLGSFLYAQGTPELTIMRVLRHANVNVTRAHYIKTLPIDVINASKQITFGKSDLA